MQELEKILAEIDEIYVDDIGVGVDCNLEGGNNIPCDNCYECIKEACKNIIRKHMNDGWVPVEEKLPEDDVDVLETYADIDDDRCKNCIHHKVIENSDICDYVEYYTDIGVPVPYPYFFKQDYPCKGHQERSEEE